MFDNLEDPAVIRDCAPQGTQYGHVLITGRRQFAEWHDRSINLECFNMDESLVYLEQAAGVRDTKQNTIPHTHTYTAHIPHCSALIFRRVRSKTFVTLAACRVCFGAVQKTKLCPLLRRILSFGIVRC